MRKVFKILEHKLFEEPQDFISTSRKEYVALIIIGHEDCHNIIMNSDSCTC